MMRKYLLTTAIAALALFQTGCAGQKEKPEGMRFVNLRDVKVNDSFWSPKFKIWSRVTTYDVLNKFEAKYQEDPVEKRQGNTFQNFDDVAAGKRGTGHHAGFPWFDGLVYETIRGIADYLVQYPDSALESRVDGYIARIAAAQKVDPNGYLETYTELVEPTHRWGENGGFLRWQHEVYNAGMMVEAGVHYYQATGKTNLLEVATRLANYMADSIGVVPKKNIVPAHSGPEEAFIKLYWLYKSHPGLKKRINVPVDEQKYWTLASFFIEDRGHHCGYPLWGTWGGEKSEKWIREDKYVDARFGSHSRPSWGVYAQDSIPVFQQQTIEGHAVRATLMATGLATAALENHSPEYIESAKRLWDNMVGKRMFVTGGVGAIAEDEKFGPDYFLPSDAYLETCAAVGAGFFSGRMMQLTGNGMYMDILERVLYNSMLTAVSLSGTNYTYQNPLNAQRHNRWEWHDCPCCPPMFLKMTGLLPSYIYSYQADTAYVNLFIGSEASLPLMSADTLRIRQETNYPWKGEIRIVVNPLKESLFTLKVRIPGWARGEETPYGLYRSDLKTSPVVLNLNGQPVGDLSIKNGYAVITRIWKVGDKIELTLPVEPRIVTANPEVKNLSHQASLAAGPIVYCFESCDNPAMEKVKIDAADTLLIAHNNRLLEGINVITVKNRTKAMAIPYYAIANRERDSQHDVWVRYLPHPH